MSWEASRDRVCPSTGVPSRKWYICANFLDNVITEEEDFERDGYSEMDGREEQDNKSGSFRLSLIIQCNGSGFVEEKKLAYRSQNGVYVCAQKPSRQTKCNRNKRPTHNWHRNNTKNLFNIES